MSYADSGTVMSTKIHAGSHMSAARKVVSLFHVVSNAASTARVPTVTASPIATTIVADDEHTTLQNFVSQSAAHFGKRCATMAEIARRCTVSDCAGENPGSSGCGASAS